MSIQLLTILLQATGPVTAINPGGFLNSLMDKGPVIGLLILAVYYFYRLAAQQTKDIQALTDKMESYMINDRATMQTALENNTQMMADIKDLLKTKP